LFASAFPKAQSLKSKVVFSHLNTEKTNKDTHIIRHRKGNLRKCSPSGCKEECETAVRSYCKPKAKHNRPTDEAIDKKIL